jgi:hypothetical protein
MYCSPQHTMATQTRLRPYRPSNLYRRDPPTAELEAAAAELRAQFIADNGGPEAISTAERLLIDLAVEAAIKHDRVSAYPATLPSLVDKRDRKVWTVVLDAARLSDRLGGLRRLPR